MRLREAQHAGKSGCTHHPRADPTLAPKQMFSESFQIKERLFLRLFHVGRALSVRAHIHTKIYKPRKFAVYRLETPAAAPRSSSFVAPPSPPPAYTR